MILNLLIESLGFVITQHFAAKKDSNACVLYQQN